MKRLSMILVLGILAIFILSGCASPDNINANVKITKSVDFKGDPALFILCEKAVLDRTNRTVIVEGLVSIGGSSDVRWVAPLMKIQENKLIIYLADNEKYRIEIGTQCFNLGDKDFENRKNSK